MDVFELFTEYQNGNMTKEEFASKINDLRDDPEASLEVHILHEIMELGREEIRERFRILDDERKSILMTPGKTESEIELELLSKAAFMHEDEIKKLSLPVTDDTIKKFLEDEDEDEGEEDEIDEDNEESGDNT